METIVVYIQETSEQTISIPLDDNATAQEVLRSLSFKKLNSQRKRASRIRFIHYSRQRPQPFT
jgi:hypothetical protein